VCNGNVVYVAKTLADAETYVTTNVQTDFQVSVTVSGDVPCTGSTCKGSVSCSTTPGTGHGSDAFLAGGLALGLVSVSRRRNNRKA
jgi:MYXO-CTERM domain-containing protein